MTPEAAVEWLSAFSRFERSGMRPGLERIHGLLEVLDHPEADLAILHVAGTNGKGSVSALAEAILRAAGHRTGLYTSPHLLDLSERIRIAGAAIAPAMLARYVEALAPRVDTDGATFFEVLTAVALAAFRDAAVDVAVLEVGMGGRWDATNVGAPLVSVVTRVDYDHEEFLGRRLEEIAAEKAAIIRGGTALSAAQSPEVTAVVSARCRALGVPLLVEGEGLGVQSVRADLHGHRLDLAGPGWTLADLELGLLGLFQSGNAALAVGAVRAFAGARALAVPEAAVREGCARVRWPGRFQVVPGLPGRPTVVLDGAHNPVGAAALAASLRHYFPGGPLTLVLGISTDKDRAGILKALAPLAVRVFLTAARNARATPPEELAAALLPVEAEVVLIADPAIALRRALDESGEGVVCVAGSLFLIADALRWLEAQGLVPGP